jgi:protein O-mannosyl-transferase
MSGRAASSSTSPRSWLLPVIVLAITCAVFVPSLSNGFVNWDDDTFVYQNANVQTLDWTHLKAVFSTPVLGAYSPLVILSFAIEKSFFGLNPGVFHLDNLILHLICVYLAYRLFRALNLSQWAAAIAALLFGIHPMHVESVAWVTERKDVLYSAFYLGALLFYVRYVQTGSKKCYWWVLGLLALSLLSKIQAVALPLSLLALDYLFKRRGRSSVLFEKAPFFLLSIIVGVIGVAVLAKSDVLMQTYAGPGRWLIGAFTFCVYLIKAVVPYKLSPFYAPPIALNWAYYVAPVAVLLLGWWLWREHRAGNRAVVFGFVFFAVNVVFVLQVLGAGQGFLADRYVYMAYVGLFFVSGNLIDKCRTAVARKTVWAAAMVYAAVFAMMTWNQCAIWEDGETLWTFVMRQYPENAFPYYQRAFYYRTVAESSPENKQPVYYNKALVDYRRAAELVDQLPDATKQKIMVHVGFAQALFDAGETEASIKQYSRVLGLGPNYSTAYVNRGAAYGKLAQKELALADFNRALQLTPDNAGAFFNRGVLYRQTSKYELAIADFTTYLRLKPSCYEAYLQRAEAFDGLGKGPEALRDAKTAQDHGIAVNAMFLAKLERYEQHL